MKIFKTKNELIQWRTKRLNQSIGFVPTMGALHEGHLSLVRAAKKECKKVVVSIFVNKLQFGPNEDFDKYPRLIELDIKLLQKECVDILFVPEKDQMYPNNMTFKLIETKISQTLEGASRPNFFSGVLTIVLKLFNLIQPNVVFFGEKDIQQLYIIKKMIQDFNLPVLLSACSTVREKNGLAMSSRNKYLTQNEQLEASILYKTLQKGAKLIKEKKTIHNIKKTMIEAIKQKHVIIDYLEIVDFNTFSVIEDFYNKKIVLVGAIYYKKIRLIDNIIIQS